MQASLLFKLIIIIIVGEFLLERLLDYLNAKYWSDKIPEEANGIYDEEKYKKSQNYMRAKLKLSIVSSTFSLVLLMGMLFLNGFALLDSWVREFTNHPILLALMFFGVLALAMDVISTPLSIYSTFVIEEKFGFNKTSPKVFVLDKLKSWLLAIILGGGLLSLIVWIYILSGTWFWLIVLGVMAIFMVFMTMFYSSLIVPLFNKQTPLEEGNLRSAIEDFSTKVGFRLNNIFVIDGSKRSSKANAYFSGLGPKKRIVLYDTLIKDHSVNELVAVLAHEIGHYKKKHTLLGLIVSLLQTAFMLFILSYFISDPSLSLALGSDNHSFHLAVLAFGILYSPVSTLLDLFTNLSSRKNEYAADRFAGEEYDSESLMLALKKLSVNNLSNLRPHPLYVFFYYSHPPLLKRLEALKGIK